MNKTRREQALRRIHSTLVTLALQRELEREIGGDGEETITAADRREGREDVLRAGLEIIREESHVTHD